MLAAVGWLVPGASDDDECFLGDSLRHEIRIVVGKVAQAQCGIAPSHQLAHLSACGGLQDEAHLGKAADEGAKNVRQLCIGERTHCTHESKRNGRCLTRLQVAYRRRAIPCVGQHRLGIGQEGRSGIGMGPARRRSNSFAPNSLSSSLIRRLMAGCERPRLAAAALKLRSRAIVTKERIWSRSIRRSPSKLLMGV